MTTNMSFTSPERRDPQPQVPSGGVNIPPLYVRPGEHFQWQAQVRRGGTDRNLAMLQSRLNAINRESFRTREMERQHDERMREAAVKYRQFSRAYARGGNPGAAFQMQRAQMELNRQFPKLAALDAMESESFSQRTMVSADAAQERRYPAEGMIGKRTKEWWEHDPNEAAQAEAAIQSMQQFASIPSPQGVPDAMVAASPSAGPRPTVVPVRMNTALMPTEGPRVKQSADDVTQKVEDAIAALRRDARLAPLVPVFEMMLSVLRQQSVAPAAPVAAPVAVPSPSTYEAPLPSQPIPERQPESRNGEGVQSGRALETQLRSRLAMATARKQLYAKKGEALQTELRSVDGDSSLDAQGKGRKKAEIAARKTAIDAAMVKYDLIVKKLQEKTDTVHAHTEHLQRLVTLAGGPGRLGAFSIEEGGVRLARPQGVLARIFDASMLGELGERSFISWEDMDLLQGEFEAEARMRS